MSRKKKYSNTNFQAALFALSLDRDEGQPLHLQLTEGLRDLILSGRAVSGARLPSSRQLAQELSVSRVTTLTALDQLVAEGYLETRPGAGTFVAQDLPQSAPLSGLEQDVAGPSVPKPYAPLTPGLPELAEFPHAEWARHLERAWQRPDPALLSRPDPMGWAPLRVAIAEHLGAWRGLRCSAGQVIVTSGASESFDLLASALFNTGDRVAIEEPAFPPMRAALIQRGVDITAFRVDQDGLPVQSLPNAMKGVVVTPSRNYPLGTTLPLSRRLALLDYAARNDSWVVEDDYDGEFRYTGQPLPALASLDQGGRVIYIGSFSKLLSPALRLSYMVVPRAALAPVQQALGRAGPRASLVPQPALAGFMQSGGFATHLRRMRRLYAHRQKVLLAALAPLTDQIAVAPDAAGMHLVCPLLPECRARDVEIVRRATDAGLGVRALSTYFSTGDAQQGLVMGYAGFDDDTLRKAASTLRTCFG